VNAKRDKQIENSRQMEGPTGHSKIAVGQELFIPTTTTQNLISSYVIKFIVFHCGIFASQTGARRGV
jgi:hypothetical protein